MYICVVMTKCFAGFGECGVTVFFKGLFMYFMYIDALYVCLHTSGEA